MPNPFIADPKLFQALEQRSITVPCSKGQILFKQGEVPIGLYLLKTGKASLIMKTEKGKEVVHLTVSAGSILGLPAIVSSTIQSHSMSAGLMPHMPRSVTRFASAPVLNRTL